MYVCIVRLAPLQSYFAIASCQRSNIQRKYLDVNGRQHRTAQTWTVNTARRKERRKTAASPKAVYSYSGLMTMCRQHRKCSYFCMHIIRHSLFIILAGLSRYLQRKCVGRACISAAHHCRGKGGDRNAVCLLLFITLSLAIESVPDY